MSTYGPAYEEKLDGKRINKQMRTIRDYMLAGGWHTLDHISTMLGYPEGSVSANLRHLRKARFGGYLVDKRRIKSAGTWEYRVLEPTEENRQLKLPLQ